jgi:hypothetical protein
MLSAEISQSSFIFEIKLQIIQLSTLNTQHSTLNTQHSTLNTQHSILNPPQFRAAKRSSHFTLAGSWQQACDRRLLLFWQSTA